MTHVIYNEPGLEPEQRALLCVWCGNAVDNPQPDFNAKIDQPYCTAHHSLAHRDPRDIGTYALEDAETLLNMPASSLVRWPWRAVNELAGPIVPGRLTYVAGWPGGGKTTLISHLLRYWLDQGLRVSMLPLEADPLEVMARLACLELGINADLALSMKLRMSADAGDPFARKQLAELTEWMRAQRKNTGFLKQLRIEPLESLTPQSFAKSVHAAALMESDILVVDHVDEVEGEANDATPEIQLSNQIQSAALRLAKYYRIPVILATQLNSSRTGGDPLAFYRAPRSDFLYNKGKKEQKAATILGLYRPMDMTLVDKDTNRAVAAGSMSASSIAKANTMGIVGMKLRYGGSALGSTCELHYEHGKLADLAGHDALESSIDRHGIATGPKYRQASLLPGVA